eukprot:TRINITY_DN22100_c0_g1_i1.p1 TRINITY_DN22100_c0_g1~~TRINITY_DN22100_c0_g1_i1.p1  ORF type:complete len:150 (+),score=23.32 TRINITY_DN22100_c0_g1_i1:22-471(+)
MVKGQKKDKRNPNVCANDVDPKKLVVAFAAFLKKEGKIQLPKNCDLIKTAPNKELPPDDPDWYYVRAAAVFRRIYVRPGTGIGALTKVYGSGSRKGVMPQHHQNCARGHIRHAMQQFEKMGLMEHSVSGGRKVTSKGCQMLDRMAHQCV